MTNTPDPTRDRPSMPPGYGIPADPSPEMLAWSETRAKIARSRNYWIVTAGAGGRPHAAPVWGLWLDGAFMFSTDLASRKARNFQANPEIVVHLESGDDVVILEGAIEQVTDRAILERFVDDYDRKYQFRPDLDEPSGAYFRLRLRTAMAWLEPDFPKTATRWRFEPTSPP